MTNKIGQGEMPGQDLPGMIKQKRDEMLQTGELQAGASDPDTQIDTVVNNLGIDLATLTPEMREQLKQEMVNNAQGIQDPNAPAPNQQSTTVPTQTGTMSTQQQVIGSSDTRSLLIKLNNHYAKNGLNFMEALKVWKHAKLTPEAIRDQVRSDVKSNVSLAEAKALYKTGSQMMLGYSDLGLEREVPVDDSMQTKRTIKMTPSVKSSVERIGQNLFRTKNASMLWKIDMKTMDDGQSVPYLVRVDTVEANETEEDMRIK
jgi:hypothetical protein